MYVLVRKTRCWRQSTVPWIFSELFFIRKKRNKNINKFVIFDETSHVFFQFTLTWLNFQQNRYQFHWRFSLSLKCVSFEKLFSISMRDRKLYNLIKENEWYNTEIQKVTICRSSNHKLESIIIEISIKGQEKGEYLNRERHGIRHRD